MMRVRTWSARRNPAIATGIAGVLLGTVIGTAASWTAAPGPSAAAPAQGTVSNMGQYRVHNMGGTPTQRAWSNMGQYSPHNMGGTPVE